MFLRGSQYPLYYPQYISGYEKVKMSTMNPTSTMETEPLTRGIVIFGATGDLCRKKLIPALHRLWEKGLLPENFLITGSSRRDPGRDDWIRHLGDYPEEFLHHLDYVCSDLEDPESLKKLPEADDTTYFLSVPPERYENAIILSLIHI